MISKFTSNALRRSPDQTVYGFNQLRQEVAATRSSLRLWSEDGKDVIIIGNQPINPATRKPYGFGIRKYAVKGDRLELIGEVEWT